MGLAFGIGCLTKDPPNQFTKFVKNIEDWGFDTIWISDQDLFRDCYVSLALAALNTTKIRLGTAVTNPITRHPAITTEAIGTIDELSGGRAILGIAIGGSILKGLELKSSVSICRESIFLIRRLLAGEKLSYTGRHFNLRDMKLDFETRADIPIYVAASGPIMLRVAGEIADGVISSTGVSHENLRFMFKNIREGTEKVDKKMQDFHSVCWTATSISENVEEAREDVKDFVAWAIANTPILGKVSGIDEENIHELREAYFLGGGRFGASGTKKFVTDEMVDKFAVAGTIEDCVRKIRVIAREGVNEFAFLPRGKNWEQTVRTFAEQVMPAFRD